MSKKLYARQINPEYQGNFITDIFSYDEAFNNISVCGNRHYIERKTDVFLRVFDALNDGDLANELENVGQSYSWYKNVTECINDYLYREDGKKYSCKDIHNLKQLIEEFSECRSNEENRIICNVLSIVTRKDYDYTTIRGCCQGEWNEVFYPVDEYTMDDIRTFEAYYFNTGSEWIIHDEENEPESAEEINGYSVYCVSFDVRQELAEYEGISPDDVILYEYHEQMQPYYVAV